MIDRWDTGALDTMADSLGKRTTVVAEVESGHRVDDLFRCYIDEWTRQTCWGRPESAPGPQIGLVWPDELTEMRGVDQPVGHAPNDDVASARSHSNQIETASDAASECSRWGIDVCDVARERCGRGATVQFTTFPMPPILPGTAAGHGLPEFFGIPDRARLDDRPVHGGAPAPVCHRLTPELGIC